MIGTYIVILWLTLFTIVSYSLCKYLNISGLLCVIFVWTFLMGFVAIFEMLLIYYYEYLETRGKKYYAENKCYWSEDNNLLDIFSYKLYMDLYADYSLCDKRYCENMRTSEGNRFVFLGEVIHGIFCIIMTTIILYFYFIDFNEVYIYLSSIIFSAIQFALIVWYLASIFYEMKFVKNELVWYPPLLWNVPWVIIPLYIIYYGTLKIVTPPTI